MTREQELKRSIADLEAKRAYTILFINMDTNCVFSGKREASSQEAANF